jgi:ABC-type branched-subunit amino acid transport system substrate-binding protein
MQPSRVKICPDCSYANNVHTQRCVQCKRSLAGVRPDFQPSLDQLPPEEPTQVQGSQQTISLDQLPSEEPAQAQGTQQTISLDQLPPEGPVQAQGTQQTVLLNPLPSPVSQKPVPAPITPLPEIISPSPATKAKRNSVVKLLMVIIALLAIAALLFALLTRFLGGNSSTSTALYEFKASNGKLIGINDGSLAPFLSGADKIFKQQAADQLKQGHASQAISLLQVATRASNNDPEAWIYLENQRVLLSGLPYMTLVIGTDLLDTSGAGQNDLQGVYVAQHEFNAAHHGFQVRLLIANSGNNTNDVSTIARQIVGIANQDKTVVGVVSWLTSNENLTVLPILSSAHIPIISPTASSDQLTNISSFFFRVVPPNRTQGKSTALFAERTLKATKVVVFVDNNDSYSQNLTQDFENQFKKDGHTILKEEPFTTDQTTKIRNLIQDALKTHPDLLYFTGPATSDVANFQDALPTTGPFAQLPAISGDAGYVIHKAGHGRWYFASFAFANAAENAIGSSPPPFYQDYSNDFNQDNLKPAGYYGYTRPDDIAMLSYDVTSVFLKAMQQAVANSKVALTSNGLQHITPTLLASTLPAVVLQGITGEIAFDADHNPINKAIVFLAASPDGHIYMKDWQGCFTKDLCHNVS